MCVSHLCGFVIEYQKKEKWKDNFENVSTVMFFLAIDELEAGLPQWNFHAERVHKDFCFWFISISSCHHPPPEKKKSNAAYETKAVLTRGPPDGYGYLRWGE